MPAAPEFPDGEREIRAFEICHQLNAEQSGTADGDIGITGEITVYFDGEHQRCNKEGQSYIGLRIIVYIIDSGGKDVGDHQLLKISPDHQLQPVSHVFIDEGAFLPVLRQEAFRSADRAGQKLRKEGDEQCIVAEMSFRPALTAIDVDQIAHGLEEIEGNACRQQERQGERLQGQFPGGDHFIEAADHRSCCLVQQKDQDQREYA